jgi:hypothetical protein
MPQPYLLPSAFPATKRRSNLASIFVGVFLVVFAGAGFLIWQKVTPHDDAIPAQQVEKAQAAPTTPTTPVEPLMEDLNVHFDNAIRNTIKAGDLIRQSQRRIRATLPAMDRNYLSVERSRLEAADALAEEAVREANRAAEELEVARKLAQQNLNKGEKQ